MLALALFAAAQASDTIEVIARKPEEVRREAQAFVRQVGVAERPVARWVDPICLKVFNLDAAMAAKVEARIAEIARDAGAKLARRGCPPNLKIVFSTDAGELTREVAAKSPDSFGELTPSARALMYGATAASRWWHTVQDRTADGARAVSAMGDPPPGMTLDAGGGTVSLGGAVHQQYRSSFLGTQMVRGIIAAKVIVDVKHATGVPLEAVAAHAAMVGLAEIRFGDPAPPNSVLGLYEGGGARELTTLDLNFLRALYRLPLDRTAVAHRGMLVRGMTRTVDR